MYPGCVDVCILSVLIYVSRLCGCMYPEFVDICIQVVWMYIS